MVHRAGDVAHLQEVADAHGLVEDQRRTGDDVLERFLRGEGDRDPAHAEPGEGGRRVDTEMAQRQEDRAEDNHNVYPAPQQPEQ